MLARPLILSGFRKPQPSSMTSSSTLFWLAVRLMLMFLAPECLMALLSPSERTRSRFDATSSETASSRGPISWTIGVKPRSRAPAWTARRARSVSSPAPPGAVREVSQALARATAPDRLSILHDLFYTPAWPYSPQDSSLLGDATMSQKELAAHRKASRQHDAWELLPSIIVPTLVLHGEDDLMTPAGNARLIADRIPGARLEVYPQSRHGFLQELSAQVTPAVIEFFKESSTG